MRKSGFMPKGTRPIELGQRPGLPTPPIPSASFFGAIQRPPVGPDHYTEPRMAPLKTGPRPPGARPLGRLPGFPFAPGPLPASGFGMGQRGHPPEDRGEGHAALTRPEVADLVATLDLVLRPIEADERALADHACLREMKAGPFPLVVRLRARAAAFLARSGGNQAGVPGETVALPAAGEVFSISRGELEVLEKAVACASSLGRGKIVTYAVVGGGAAAAVLALLLL